MQTIETVCGMYFIHFPLTSFQIFDCPNLRTLVICGIDALLKTGIEKLALNYPNVDVSAHVVFSRGKGVTFLG